AIKPNLMQTSEGTPAFIHTGPFGNIAHGNSSVVADLIALPRADYLVTEAGFGADMGAEKLFHIKAPVSGLIPDAVVVAATACAQPSSFVPLYQPEQMLREKVHALATRMYGAADVKWDRAAELAVDRFTAAGYGNLPVCMAKTHLSISHDPNLKGAPSGYVFPV